MHMHMKTVQSLFLGAVIMTAFFFSGCVKESDPEVPAIGDIREGGIVSHIFQPGEEGYVEGRVTGIITAPLDVVFESQWGCQGTAVGGTSTAVGRGRINTERVLAFHNSLPDFFNNPTQCHPNNNGSVGARVALEFSSGGFDDWFMPSQQEMGYLFRNKDVIGGFTEAEYWSSCESNAQAACAMSFITGEFLSRDKSEFRRVRVIRFF
jgi:hypothetical protein